MLTVSSQQNDEKKAHGEGIDEKKAHGGIDEKEAHGEG